MSHAREQRVNPLYFEALAWQEWMQYGSIEVK